MSDLGLEILCRLAPEDRELLLSELTALITKEVTSQIMGKVKEVMSDE